MPWGWVELQSRFDVWIPLGKTLRESGGPPPPRPSRNPPRDPPTEASEKLSGSQFSSESLWEGCAPQMVTLAMQSQTVLGSL